MTNRSTSEVDEIIANGNRIVEEAQEALERFDRLCVEHNIDPQHSVELLRQHLGDAAVETMRAEVQAEIARMEEETQQRRMHQPKKRPAGSAPRVRTNLI